jgi:hypothetical protein
MKEKKRGRKSEMGIDRKGVKERLRKRGRKSVTERGEEKREGGRDK